MKKTDSADQGRHVRVGGFAVRGMRVRGGEYARRGWSLVAQIKEIGSGASQRELRETPIGAAPWASSH